VRDALGRAFLMLELKNIPCAFLLWSRGGASRAPSESEVDALSVGELLALDGQFFIDVERGEVGRCSLAEKLAETRREQLQVYERPRGDEASLRWVALTVGRRVVLDLGDGWLVGSPSFDAREGALCRAAAAQAARRRRPPRRLAKYARVGPAAGTLC
jgi:hypothetical protein